MSLLAPAENEIIKQDLPDCSGKLCLLFHFFFYESSWAGFVLYFCAVVIENLKICTTQRLRLHCRFLPFFLDNLNPHLYLSFYQYAIGLCTRSCNHVQGYDIDASFCPGEAQQKQSAMYFFDKKKKIEVIFYISWVHIDVSKLLYLQNPVK